MGQTVTPRDRVWAWLLERHSGYRFKIGQVHPDYDDFDDRPSEATVRRVLKAAIELGIVEHQDCSPYYRVVEQ